MSSYFFVRNGFQSIEPGKPHLKLVFFVFVFVFFFQLLVTSEIHKYTSQHLQRLEVLERIKNIFSKFGLKSKFFSTDYFGFRDSY